MDKNTCSTVGHRLFKCFLDAGRNTRPKFATLARVGSKLVNVWAIYLQNNPQWGNVASTTTASRTQHLLPLCPPPRCGAHTMEAGATEHEGDDAAEGRDDEHAKHREDAAHNSAQNGAVVLRASRSV